MSTKDNLLEQKLFLQEDIDRIKSQIALAKANAAANGEYADKDWFLRANHSLKRKGRQMQRLQLEISRAGATERANRAGRFEQAFIDEARRILPAQLFAEVATSARNIVEAS